MRRALALVGVVLCLSGCSVRRPTPDELFAGAYGTDPVSATFDHSMIMEGYTDNMNMSVSTIMTLENVFDSKAHVRCVIGGVDASVDIDLYRIESDGKTLTYARNSVGNYDLIQESDEFLGLLPELDSSRYDNLSVKPDKAFWRLTGTIPISELSGLELAVDDVDLNAEFIFDKTSGYIQRMHISLPDEIVLSDSTVTGLELDIQVSKINETDFELPEFKEDNGNGNDN